MIPQKPSQQSLRNDTSSRLRDMAQVPAKTDRVAIAQIEAGERTTARESQSGASLVTGIVSHSTGEVGASQRVKLVNNVYQIFDNVSGASVLGPGDISTVWTGFGGSCETRRKGESVVLFDEEAGRWLISQFASATTGQPANEECFAVSTTSDATGAYHRYSFHLGANFFDSPHLSVRPNGYVMGDNVFDGSGVERLGTQFFVFDRTAMLAGKTATWTSPGIDTGVGETYSISANGVRLKSNSIEPAVSTLTINLTYDPDSTFTNAGLTASDIANMKAANTYAASQFTGNFKDPINVNIRVTAVPGTSTLGMSNTFIPTTTFSNMVAKTSSDATSADDATATGSGGSIPAGLADPVGGTHVYRVSQAQSKALGITPDDAVSTDGTYTFGGGFSYTYDPNNRAVFGKTDYIGVSMHEFSEIMGRIGLMGTAIGGTSSYMQFDLFHYTGAGVRGLNDGGGRSFSINNGTTLLKAFNNAALHGGDLQDWASGTNDSFNAFSGSGVKNDLTAVDIRNMDVIGYDLVAGVAPANDNFANAQVITGNTSSTTGSNVRATKESGEPNHAGDSGGASIWYQWQAPASGSVTIDTAGSNFDTLLGVYTGSSVSALTTIASNDDENNAGGILTSKVVFNAVSGTLYRIAVDGFSGATGNVTLHWDLPTGTSSLRIDTVSPLAGRTSGGQSITLTGNFSGLSTVTMGGVNAAFTGNASTITVTTPAHSVGAVQIVLTPTSGSPYSKPNAFAYLPTVFTNDTIQVGQTTAKAQHIIELRGAVDAMRAVAGLGGAPWVDPTLAPGNTIKAAHILDLRTYLNDAASRLGYATSSYSDPSLTSGFTIKRVHIEELRQRIRTIAG
jgi:hypothetical protein